jgi:hypothetical protein
VFDLYKVHRVLTRLAGFYSASSLKQQYTDISVAPLGHIILIPSQPVCIGECPSNSPFLKNNGVEAPKGPSPIVCEPHHNFIDNLLVLALIWLKMFRGGVKQQSLTPNSEMLV